jgi:hypothetical protein
MKYRPWQDWVRLHDESLDYSSQMLQVLNSVLPAHRLPMTLAYALYKWDLADFDQYPCALCTLAAVNKNSTDFLLCGACAVVQRGHVRCRDEHSLYRQWQRLSSSPRDQKEKAAEIRGLLLEAYEEEMQKLVEEVK